MRIALASREEGKAADDDYDNEGVWCGDEEGYLSGGHGRAGDSC